MMRARTVAALLMAALLVMTGCTRSAKSGSTSLRVG